MENKQRIMAVMVVFARGEFGVEILNNWDEIESMVLSADEMQDFSTNEQVLEEGGIVYTYTAEDLPEWDEVAININVITNNDHIVVDVSMDTEEGNTHLDYDASKYVGEDISAIQSELAKEYSKKLRSEAPWILSED